MPQRLNGACAQHHRGFIQRFIQLLKGCRPRAHTHRQIAKHKAQHDDQRGTRQLKRRNVKRQDVAHTQHSARNSEREQG